MNSPYSIFKTLSIKKRVDRVDGAPTDMPVLSFILLYKNVI